MSRGEGVRILMMSKAKLVPKGIDMSHRHGAHGAFSAVSRGLAVLGITAVAGIVHGCSDIVVQPVGKALTGGPGKMGDPCIPDSEKNYQFPGFKVSEINLVSNDFDACETGVCLVNHFQGRVSCPLGQPAPKPCHGGDDTTTCAADEKCVEAGVLPVFCEGTCYPLGSVCNSLKGACECSTDAHCPEGTTCDTATKECKRYVCRGPAAGCQSADASDEENAGKACCMPGTGMPVAAAVCGQCDSASKRDATNAVYCSCRCGAAEGAPPEDAEYCTCPDGFECKQVIPYVGLGDPSLTGKFCVKPATSYESGATCGLVNGYADPSTCSGIAASP